MEENQENNFYELKKIMIDENNELTKTGVKIISLMAIAIAIGIVKQLVNKGGDK